MRKGEHLVLCGGAQPPKGAGGRALRLDLHGPSANVELRISDLARRLLVNIPDPLPDLLEIATYVYAADGAISRGGRTDSEMGARWRRTLRFRIPVRQPEVWSAEPVSSALAETLSFLSDEQYAFDFVPFHHPPSMAGYFEFPLAQDATFCPDEVILFSGGLDSFAGAAEELIANGSRVALVSHRSAAKISSAQIHLVNELRRRAGRDRVLYVPVRVTMKEGLGREPSHRARSFLFAALGAVTARLFNLRQMKFFENGIVSLNLPPVEQVVGARATRTTHPQALAGFRRLFAQVLDQTIEVINPFIWLTKTEVIDRIAANECGDLIPRTRSCTRVRDMTILHPHCGECSQCLDRRFAVLAAGQEHHDVADAYKVDLFTGERPRGPDREMALAYVRSASEIAQMADEAFFARFGEVSRVVGYFPEAADEVASRVLELHRRHVSSVCRVFDQAVSLHASALRQGSLPATCLLVLKVSRGEETPPEPERRSEEVFLHPSSEIPISIDEDRRRVVFERWGELAGTGARLITALSKPFQDSFQEARAPEHYSYTRTGALCSQINCANEETLRRQVLRLRKAIEALASKAGDLPPAMDAVIESSPWHGYRLNPDSVRIVAVGHMSTTLNEKVTARADR